MRAAVDIAAAAARPRQIPIELDAAADLPAVRVDAIQVEQVVLNLLLNAIEATTLPARGTITVSTARYGADAVEVCVRDRGIGIDPTVADRIFEPFLTTKPNGLGMGLAISRSIVAAHGGQIWAMPETPRGTVFRFTLPTAAAAPGDIQNR